MTNKVYRLAALALAVVMLLSAAACGGGTTSGGGSGTPSGGGSGTGGGAADDISGLIVVTKPEDYFRDLDHPTAKDVYRWSTSAEPASLDHSHGKDTLTWTYLYNVYDTLIGHEWTTGEYYPALAESFQVNEDATEVYIKIREDIKFHNGDTMTMEDVMFSMNRTLESTFTAQLTQNIERMEQISDTEMKVVLKWPYAPILDLLVSPSWGITSKRAVEEAEAAGVDFARNPVGTGAYMLQEWRSGESLTFVAFEDHYRGSPRIKTIETIIIADPTAGMMALESGQVDYAYGINRSDYHHVLTLPNVIVYENPIGTGVWDITFNTQVGTFSDKLLRQAVAYAIDREEILVGGAEGQGQVIDCVNIPGAFGFLDDFEWYKQDQDKARELMAEAGYPDGFTVVFKQEGVPVYMPAAEVMQAQLKQVGIDVVFEKLERAAWIETVATNMDYEASLRMTTQTVNDADYILTRRLTTGMIGGSNNYANYSNPAFDALVEEARSLSDNARRLELYRQCYEIIKEDVPTIPLYTMNTRFSTNSKLRGFNCHPNHRDDWFEMYFID